MKRKYICSTAMKEQFEREMRLDARKHASKKEKHNAVEAVNNAIRDGRLQRKPCEQCGAWPAQAHHENYSRQLDVRWLCLKHHRALHASEDYAEFGHRSENGLIKPRSYT